MKLTCERRSRFMTSLGGTPWVLGTEAFVGLEAAERQVLASWSIAARAAGIDMVADFTPRPWHLAALDVVIGVFEHGRTTASWLLVRYQSQWVLAAVKHDAVSHVCTSLIEALTLINGHLSH